MDQTWIPSLALYRSSTGWSLHHCLGDASNDVALAGIIGSSISCNQPFKVLDNLGHRGSLGGIMSPHAFDESNNFRAILFSQSGYRRPVATGYQRFRPITQHKNRPLSLGAHSLVNGMFIHPLLKHSATCKSATVRHPPPKGISWSANATGASPRKPLHKKIHRPCDYTWDGRARAPGLANSLCRQHSEPSIASIA